MITIVGLGTGGLDQLTLGAWEALQHAETLLLRTEHHPAVPELVARGVRFTALDNMREGSEGARSTQQILAEAHDERLARRESTKKAALIDEKLASLVLEAAQAGDVVYAVPGHPMVDDRSVPLLLKKRKARRIEARIFPGVSYLDTALSAASLAVPGAATGAFAVRDATTLDPPDPSVPTLLIGVDPFRNSKGPAGSLLMEDYPRDHGVVVIRGADLPDDRHRWEGLPLYHLIQSGTYLKGADDYVLALYVPPVPVERRRRPTFDDFVAIIARLRGPDGCPWDREQTFESLKRFMIEEAYEAVEAVDTGQRARLCDELGDVLIQVVLNSQLAAEEGSFTICEVIANVTDKLIRRHPHVFGDVSVADSAEVLRNWEQIKRQERPERTSVLDGVPRDLPALMKAMEVSKRVVRVGFEWPTLDEVFAKLEEEIAELRAALPEGDHDAIAGEIGDLLFTTVNIARFLKVDPEDALRTMVARFTDRFRHVEQLAAQGGKPLTEMSIDELDALWEAAKSRLR